MKESHNSMHYALINAHELCNKYGFSLDVHSRDNLSILEIYRSP